MKKINNNGFTLIELLAAITIMGILMMIAIPSVSRYITKSKKNAFVYTAKQYAKAVEKAYLLEKLECGDDGISPYDEEDGSFQVLFSTDPSRKEATNHYAYENYQALISDGGKSPFDAAYINGFVSWAASGDGDPEFAISIYDSNRNGIPFGKVEDLSPSNVYVGNVNAMAYLNNNSIMFCRVK